MKGQFFSIDLFIALSIFLLVIIIIMDVWGNVRERRSSFEQIASMQMLTHDIADNLIRSEGDPPNWTSQNVKSVGLAKEDHVLSESKLKNFTEMDYNDLRQIFGINCEFYFKITGLDNVIISINDNEVTQGREPANATDLISVKRLALLNQTPVKVYFMLWR